MDQVRQNLARAWARIAPLLARDPLELRRRLARRRSKLIESPPRAWCLAVRATDTRLDEFCTSRPQRHVHPDLDPGHQVLLDHRALRGLCAPVYIPRPGLPLDELAPLLGTTPHGLLDARLNGIFQTHYVQGLGGHFGKPRPILYTNRPLDPSARSFASADPAWSGTADDLLGRIPDGIEQMLTRVPLYQPVGELYDDTSDLHPEHPDIDPPVERPARRSRTLADVDASGRRDYVWYKWKGDQYVGHDWRNPGSAAQHENRQRALARSRERVNQRRTDRPALSLPKGSLHFRGWRWLCPGCGRKVNLLFYPLPRMHLLEFPHPSGARDEYPEMQRILARESLVACQSPLTTFACDKCHHIKRTSRADPNSWNELVSYLSAGLLYGREVQRPSWYPRARRADRMDGSAPHNRKSEIGNRKLNYTPRPNARPSLRRPQIQRLLLSGFTFKQIAAHLRITYGTVLWHAQQVYKQHNVRSLSQLLRKHGITPKLKKREEVRQRLEQRQSVAQIASEMGISRMCVYNLVYMLGRAGAISGKGRHKPAQSAQWVLCSRFNKNVIVE